MYRIYSHTSTYIYTTLCSGQRNGSWSDSTLPSEEYTETNDHTCNKLLTIEGEMAITSWRPRSVRAHDCQAYAISESWTCVLTSGTSMVFNHGKKKKNTKSLQKPWEDRESRSFCFSTFLGEVFVAHFFFFFGKMFPNSFSPYLFKISYNLKLIVVFTVNTSCMFCWLKDKIKTRYPL